ncbi:MAG: D-alanyl-D-alanine carboxypeptidase/D-alanyl-D-alanine-endopeptidase [Bacteroidota bacterium]
MIIRSVISNSTKRDKKSYRNHKFLHSIKMTCDIYQKSIVYKKIIILLFICCNLFGQIKDSTALTGRTVLSNLRELRDQLDDSFNDPNFNNAVWGVLVKSLKTGEIIYKRNSDKLFNPASNIKLFTSASALKLLGPNYVYQTNILANGIIKSGKLEGDLIIQGFADPAISNRFFKGNTSVIFESWADSLLSKGITVVTGNIYGDDAAFDNNNFGKGWILDNDSNWFLAPSGALCFNDNKAMIKIKPTEVGLPAEIELIPNTKFISLVKKVITVDNNIHQNISINRVSGSNTINIIGAIQKNSKPIIEYTSVLNPTLYFLSVLKETLEKKGISIKGKISSITFADKIIIAENLSHLFTHESVPLHMIIKELNKNSNNFYAEQLLKTIGYETYNYGSTENGVQAAKMYLNSMGIDPFSFVMVDGSGLSRLNLVSPRQIVNLLTFMYSSEEFEIFYDSLPIGGMDGTLANRMKKNTAEGKVRAKPGFNENISTLSGYLNTISGETLVFSIIVNNFLVSPNLANYIVDNACNKLVNFVRN